MGGSASASADALTPDWRTRIPERLAALAAAWRDPAAWEGTAEAGGVTMPAEAMAAVAVDEVLVHGWDLAVATGQQYRADPGATEVATGFVSAATGDGPPRRACSARPWRSPRTRRPSTGCWAARAATRAGGRRPVERDDVAMRTSPGRGPAVPCSPS